MEPFQPLVVETPLGPVGLGVRQGLRASRRPVVVLIHGLGRDASVFMPMIPALDQVADIVLVELPAHGRAPAAPTPSLEVLAERMRHAIGTLLPDRRMVVLGESAGALAALALSNISAAVVAIEPPLRTAQLWPVHWARNSNPALAELYDNILGQAGGSITDLDYRHLITELACPARLLVGTEPLLPPRRVQRPPSLLSAEDRAFAASSPLVTVSEVAGGHDLLSCAPEICLQAALGALSSLSVPVR